MNATSIVKLLAEKHHDDVFVAECKMGSSWGFDVRSKGRPRQGSGSGARRLDAWAMRRSWARPLFVGYEIKVSRHDFLRDTKWRSYLPVCNKFFFVCPPGLIDPDEIGEGAGLMEVFQDGAGLRTRKRAPHREVDDIALNDVFRYLLMSRVTIEPPARRVDTPISDLEFKDKKIEKKIDELLYLGGN
jgi:hypothetical protein